MRKKRLIWNTTSAFIFLLCSIVCGFIIPKLIFSNYGSDVNGLIDSINQFLKIIVFLEFGVGAVIQSSLYRPLAEGNTKQISKIIVSANKFFKKIALALLVYVISLLVIYPRINNSQFTVKYVDFLIIAISLNLFAQYYFGIVDKILLLADQRGYIIYNIQSGAIIVTTIFSVFLIINNVSILLVELVISLIYVCRPILFRLYVKKNYSIDYKVKYDIEPIEQKWNGMAQHISTVVLDSTDSVILTIFSTLSNVSIYSVYYLVINGVRQLVKSMTSGIQSLLGELIVKKESQNLNSFFQWFEWGIHNGAMLIWACTVVLIVPFVKVYTKGVTDANYNVPVFATFICIAFATETIKLCYYILILAAGHYKETQANFIISAVINVVISAFLVKKMGLVGVAIGTLAAAVFQLFWLAYYTYKNILRILLKRFFRRVIEDIILFLIIYLTTKGVCLVELDYASWTILAIKVLLIASCETIIFNAIFERKKINTFYKTAKEKISRFIIKKPPKSH